MMYPNIITTVLLLAMSALAASASLDSCLFTANLQTVSPSSSDYAVDSLAYNRRFSYKPASIVFPTTVLEVVSAVKCASQAGVKVAARSGGHSYAANGLGGQDSSLVVDLQHLHSVKVFANNRTAIFGTGIRLGDLALALYNGGKQAIAHGTCPYVGTGGHLGCGGFGFPSRLWGLALDAVIEAQVVLANGDIVTASSTENQDLFFAVRGAAPSFGIVTSLTVKTHPAPSQNVLFSYEFNVPNSTIAAKIFLAFQNFGAKNAPPALGIHPELGSRYFAISGVYYGTKSKFQSVIQPLLNSVPQAPSSSSVNTYGWLGILQQLAGNDGNLNTSTKADQSDTFYAKSLMVAEDTPLTEAAVQSFFKYLYGAGTTTDTSWFILADLWGGPNSAINAVSDLDTAFSRRSALYTFQFYASSTNSAPPYPTDGIAFVNGMVNSITSKMPGIDFAMYNCYIDSQLSAADAHKVYYGNATTARLQTIKSQLDPHNVFSFPQAIGQ